MKERKAQRKIEFLSKMAKMPNQSFSDMCTRANAVREGKIEESGS